MSEPYCPTLPLLRETVDPRIEALALDVIQKSALSIVYRAGLRYAEARDGAPRSVIIKAIRPDWPGDPAGADRETWFYTRLLPHLGLARPRLYHAGLDAPSGDRLLLLQDLAPAYRFPPPAHRWSEAEARCLLRSYARLHSRGRELLPPPGERGWLLPPYDARLAEERLPSLAEELRRLGLWPALPGLPRLLDETRADSARFADRPDTLLHNDVYPPNGALPADLDGEAILIDWGMLGWGAAELDLAYLFMQPYRAARDLDRDAALDWYWAQRQALGDPLPSPEERAARQRHADAVLALALIPVAHERALRPFPAGSAPWRYWQSMRGVLGERLGELCEGAA